MNDQLRAELTQLLKAHRRPHTCALCCSLVANALQLAAIGALAKLAFWP